MTHLVAFDVDGGGTVVAEVEETEGGGADYVRTAGADGLPVKASQSLESALSIVQIAASKVLDGLRTLDRDDTRLSSVDVAFGIKMSGKVGAFIASSEAEANFQVTLRWTRS